VRLSDDEYGALGAWFGPDEKPGSTGDGLVVAWLRQRWAQIMGGPQARLTALMGHAPATASKIAMVEAADPVRAWTREQIEDQAWPDLMTSGEIAVAYRDAVRQGMLHYGVPEHRWGRVIRELGGDKVHDGRQVTLLDGRRMRLWAVRGPERFAFMDMSSLAQAYKSAAQRAFSDYNSVIPFPDNEKE